MNEKEKYIKVIEGAVSRRISGILHQIEYLKRLDKYIQEENNQYMKEEKIKRYNKESDKLEEWKAEFDYFVNIKMIEYFKKHNIDYSMHILNIN